MLRTICLILLILDCLAVIGCGSKKQPPAPQASTEPAQVEPRIDAKKSVADSPSPAKEPPPTAPVSSSSPLRDTVARYLQSDGQGGWRKNEKAATELEKLGADQLALLWPLLKDPQVEVRRGAAVFLLNEFDASNRDHVAAYIAALEDADSMVRARALDAVRQSSREDQIAALPRLEAMLRVDRENRAENRITAARLCGTLKRDAAQAISALQLAAKDDPDAKVRSSALVAIGQIAEPSQAAASFAASLADMDASVRLVAAARLRQLGPAAAPAAKELAAAIADSSTDIAEAAAEALIRIGPPAVEPLAAQLASSNISARKLALACLAKLGPAAKPAAAQIEKLKQEPDPQVRQLAEAALKRLAGQ